MPRQPIARRVFDRVALLVCAAGIFGGGLGLVLTAERYLALGEGWTRFCLAGVGFIALGTYFGATLPGPRAYRRRPDFWPLLLTTAASPVALLFVLIRVRRRFGNHEPMGFGGGIPRAPALRGPPVERGDPRGRYGYPA